MPGKIKVSVLLSILSKCIKAFINKKAIKGILFIKWINLQNMLITASSIVLKK